MIQLNSETLDMITRGLPIPFIFGNNNGIVIDTGTLDYACRGLPCEMIFVTNAPTQFGFSGTGGIYSTVNLNAGWTM